MRLPGNIPLRYLEPRQCVLSTRPTLVSTILGSCVALTLYDPVTKTGAVSHAFLPEAKEHSDRFGCPCTFADHAVVHMLSAFSRRGVPPERLEAKVFGGSEVLLRQEASLLNGQNGRSSVGARNIAVTLAELRKAGLVPLAQDTGGNRGRKLLFLTATGGAWVKKLGPGDTQTTIEGPKSSRR